MKRSVLFFAIAVLFYTMAVIVYSNIPEAKAAMPVEITVYQPAKPRAVYVDWYISTVSLTNDIKKYSSKGYVVKTLTSGGGGKDFILIMELY